MIPRRLDKFLADATALSRRQIKEAYQAGRIDVRPGPAHRRGEHQLFHLIFEDDEVRLDGEIVELSAPRHTYLFHKPAGILSTTSNPQGRPCLARWLNDLPPTIFPVGRLDKDTTGLMLLTDDGDLCFCLLRPWFHVPKEYHLTLTGRISTHDRRLKHLREGVAIGDDGDRPATALSVEVLDHLFGFTRLSLVIDEGRHHVVRRMARTVGLDLHHLHRWRIGPQSLGDLPEGQTRRLSDDEVDALWQACGGRDAARQRRINALRRQTQKFRDQERPHHRLENWLRTQEV